jgi:hypothetical protein
MSAVAQMIRALSKPRIADHLTPHDNREYAIASQAQFCCNFLQVSVMSSCMVAEQPDLPVP